MLMGPKYFAASFYSEETESMQDKEVHMDHRRQKPGAFLCRVE